MIINTMTKHYREAKAELKGEAISRAVRIRSLVEVAPQPHHQTGPAKPTSARVRMPDGTPMIYWTDGSLRHATGFKPGKAARKALKRARKSK